MICTFLLFVKIAVAIVYLSMMMVASSFATTTFIQTSIALQFINKSKYSLQYYIFTNQIKNKCTKKKIGNMFMWKNSCMNVYYLFFSVFHNFLFLHRYYCILFVFIMYFVEFLLLHDTGQLVEKTNKLFLSSNTVCKLILIL